MSMRDEIQSDTESDLSIGELAEATGITPDTIRVWERRYGRSVPVRLPSGHRRYTTGHMRWLRRVAEALALGHRPSKVIHLSEEDLDQLLFPGAKEGGESESITAMLDHMLDHVREYRRQPLLDTMQAVSEELGPRAFVVDWLGPLAEVIGRAWADGRIEIRHEHFMSELIEDQLRAMRYSLTVADRGPIILLATLSGEGHDLGLQMVALVCTAAGVRPEILGTQVPVEEIAAAAREMDAVGVALSVSLATGGIQTDRVIAALRQLLPQNVRLAVGGRGSRHVRRGPRDVDFMQNFADLDHWLAEFGLRQNDSPSVSLPSQL